MENSAIILHCLFAEAAKTHSKERMTVKTACGRHLRHYNDAEIQPVPGIPQKCELP